MGVLTSRYDIFQDVMDPANFPKLRGVHPDWTTDAWPDDLMIAAGLGRRPVLNMLNARYLIGPPGLTRRDLVPLNRGRTVVYRNDAALPRAWWVSEIRGVADGPQALRAVINPDFDPAREAVVLGGSGLEQPGSRPDVPPRVVEHDFHRIVIETEARQPGFLVLSEVYYPHGWKAEIDGEATSIYRTNFVLRGLSVPAGAHTITLTFDSPAYRWGRVLTWTLFPLVVLVIIEETWRTRRKARQPEAGA